MTAYLTDYLTKKGYSAKINIFNMGGLRPSPESFGLSLKSLIGKMNKEFTGRFSSSDILLLDYSGNEGFFANKNNEKAKLFRNQARASESLLRRIYFNSVPHSFPTVIYLANLALPFPNAVGTFNEYYIEFARAYNVSVWSFRDAIAAARERSINSTTSKDKSSDNDNTNNNNECSLADRPQALNHLDYAHFGDHTHPSWHVHMTQADLAAAIWEHELHACDDAILRIADSSLDTWGPVKSADNIAFNHAHLDRTVDELPPALYGNAEIAEELMCDTSAQVDPMIDLSYDIIIDPKKHNVGKPVFGSYRSSPEGAWSLGEDIVGRGGFLSSTPDAKLYLTWANLTYAGLQKLEDNKTLLIAIEYLRTYESAGRVTINFCGKPVAEVNGLWDDWKEYHVSYVQLQELKLNKKHCDVNSNDLVELELVYHSTSVPESLKEGKPEHFKVIAIKACFLVNQ